MDASSGVRMHCQTIDYSGIRYIVKEGSPFVAAQAAGTKLERQRFELQIKQAGRHPRRWAALLGPDKCRAAPARRLAKAMFPERLDGM
jgi:hypothetical protein